MLSIEFLVTSLVVVLIPGTGVLFTISTGLAQGKKAALFAALGCTLGIVPHLLATILGLSAFLHAGAMAFQALKYAGVVYLLYVAYATWKDRTAFAVDGNAPAAPPRALVGRAVLLNLLNPKLTIFFLAFLPQFMDPAARPLEQLLMLSFVFMAMTLAVFVLYGLLSHVFRKAVIESPKVQKWLRCGFAAAFSGLAVDLAASNR